MATVDLKTDEFQELHQRLDALSRDVDALNGSLRRARTARLILLLAIAALVVTTCTLFYGLYTRLTSEAYLQTLQAAATKKLEQKSDDYVRQLMLLTEQSSPILSQAFMDQFQKDSPHYMKAIEAEWGTFQKNVEAQVQDRLEGRLQQSLAKHRKTLEAEVAALDQGANIDKVAANIGKAMDRLIDRYHIAQLDRQLTALADNWEQLPAADPVKGDDGPSDLLVGSFLNLLHYKLTNLPQSVQP